MIRVIGKVYPFYDKSYYNAGYKWEIKKVIGFDSRGYAKTTYIGAKFDKEELAVEYCRWWNRKYYKAKEEA